MNALIKIGKLSKVHGLKGSVVLQLSGNDIPDNKKTKAVFIEINQIPTPFFISEIKTAGKNMVLTFDSVNTVESAQKLLNCPVLIEEKNIQKQEAVKDLTGYRLNDKEKGDLGQINEVVELPGQKLFSLLINKKEVLLPFIPDLVVKIDHRSKIVFYNAPEGLIDMYTD
ncbi:MAG: ribosome maturation factor RimM [Bacteroidia bacterium]